MFAQKIKLFFVALFLCCSFSTTYAQTLKGDIDSDHRFEYPPGFISTDEEFAILFAHVRYWESSSTFQTMCLKNVDDNPHVGTCGDLLNDHVAFKFTPQGQIMSIAGGKCLEHNQNPDGTASIILTECLSGPDSQKWTYTKELSHIPSVAPNGVDYYRIMPVTKDGGDSLCLHSGDDSHQTPNSVETVSVQECDNPTKQEILLKLFRETASN